MNPPPFSGDQSAMRAGFPPARTGWPIWSPPGFTANWEAIQAARRGATYTY